jgi:signal peptidase I
MYSTQPAGAQNAWRDIPQNYARPEASSEGKASLAACAAMLFPGLGHFVAGSYGLAAVWFGLCAGAMGAMVLGFLSRGLAPIFFFAAPIGALIYLIQWFDAGRCGRRSREPMLGDPSVRKLTAALLAAVAIATQGALFWQIQKGFVEMCYTPTPSMEPTISRGDTFLVFKGRPIARWDIVGVHVPPGEMYEGLEGLCKRVVGLPGETVEITGDGVVIDGHLMTLPPGAGPFMPMDISHNTLGDAEPMSAATGCWGRPITLGPNEYFLLGDNTMDSDDSRFWLPFKAHQSGAMPADKIISRVAGVIWPPARWRIFR